MGFSLGQSMRNFSYLLAVQMINYLFPLASFAITARALGAEGLGKLALCQAVVLYFQQFTDFGFNLTATRTVSIIKDNREDLNAVYSVTTFIKAVFSIAGYVFLFIGCKVVGVDAERTVLMMILMSGVVASVFYPIWLYQGIERMKYILYSNIISKIVILIVLACLVKQPSDVVYAAWAQSAAWLFVALFSIYQIRKNNLVDFVPFERSKIVSAIKDSAYVYSSVLSTSFYTNFNTIFVGMLFGQQVVGYYAVAERIKSLFQMLISTLSQALYPHFCKKNMSGSHNQKKFILLYLGIGLAGFACIEVLGPWVVRFMAGAELMPSVEFLRVLALVIPIVSIASYLSTLRVAASGRMRLFFLIYVSGALLHLLYIYPFATFFGHIGVPLAVIVTESLITVFLFAASKRCG